MESNRVHGVRYDRDLADLIGRARRFTRFKRRRPCIARTTRVDSPSFPGDLALTVSGRYMPFANHLYLGIRKESYERGVRLSLPIGLRTQRAVF